jgi:CRISPR-associated protein Csm5
MTTYRLELTVRSPLHIGSGSAPLRKNVDFASFGQFLYVLDVDAVLDYVLPDAADVERIEQITRSYNLASFLTLADLEQHPELYHYRVGGVPRVQEIRPQIKDAAARPYIPGSTLKGAIRTALGTALAHSRDLQFNMAQLGPRREWAARDIEQTLFGRAPRPAQAPNYDLLRAMQVADSQPVAAGALELRNVAVWPAGQRGIPIDIEAVTPDTTFRMRLKLDDYLLGPAASSLRFEARAETLRQWVAICQQHGIEHMQREAAFFAGRAPHVERFYGTLLGEAEQREPGTFFAQLGWGTGWNTKTFSRIIRSNRALLAEIVRRYRLTRGAYREGMSFPSTRHAVADRGQPLLPLGWVQVRVS